jgi:hypothetical protein
MIRTYKYRLRPNRIPSRNLDALFWQARTLYNAALEQRITVYKETGRGLAILTSGRSFEMNGITTLIHMGC